MNILSNLKNYSILLYFVFSVFNTQIMAQDIKSEDSKSNSIEFTGMAGYSYWKGLKDITTNEVSGNELSNCFSMEFAAMYFPTEIIGFGLNFMSLSSNAAIASAVKEAHIENKYLGGKIAFRIPIIATRLDMDIEVGAGISRFETVVEYYYLSWTKYKADKKYFSGSIGMKFSYNISDNFSIILSPTYMGGKTTLFANDENLLDISLNASRFEFKTGIAVRF